MLHTYRLTFADYIIRTKPKYSWFQLQIFWNTSKRRSYSLFQVGWLRLEHSAWWRSHGQLSTCTKYLILEIIVWATIYALKPLQNQALNVTNTFKIFFKIICTEEKTCHKSACSITSSQFVLLSEITIENSINYIFSKRFSEVYLQSMTFFLNTMKHLMGKVVFFPACWEHCLLTRITVEILKKKPITASHSALLRLSGLHLLVWQYYCPRLRKKSHKDFFFLLT